jgi:hypothetical protein
MIMNFVPFSHFPPFPLSKFPLTMNSMASYADFLGDLDAPLVEGDTTLEELETQAFGTCILFRELR